MVIPCILVSLGIPCFQKTSLVVIVSPVDHFKVVNIHVVIILINMLAGNLWISVKNTDCFFVFQNSSVNSSSTLESTHDHSPGIFWTLSTHNWWILKFFGQIFSVFFKKKRLFSIFKKKKTRLFKHFLGHCLTHFYIVLNPGCNFSRFLLYKKESRLLICTKPLFF